jgi:hypothetical protein
VTNPGPPDFLTFIAALLAQTGIVVAIVRTTVYFIYKKEYTPPEPCGGKLVMPYNDESKFTDAMIHWNIARTAWDRSEQRRLAEGRKEVKRMESFSGLICVLFMVFSPAVAGSPLDIFTNIGA